MDAKAQSPLTSLTMPSRICATLKFNSRPSLNPPSLRYPSSCPRYTTACPISSSITFASFAYPSRPLRYLIFRGFDLDHCGRALRPPALGRRRDLDEAMDEDAREVHVVRIDR